MVGRALHNLRLFVTCTIHDDTVIQVYDLVKQELFRKAAFEIKIKPGSQPYIADFNGDFL